MAFVYPAVALHLARNDTHCIGVARHFTAEFGIHLISRHLFSGFPTRAADRFCRPYESGSSVNGFHDQFFSVPDILSLWEDVGTQKEKRLPLSRHTYRASCTGRMRARRRRWGLAVVISLAAAACLLCFSHRAGNGRGSTGVICYGLTLLGKYHGRRAEHSVLRLLAPSRWSPGGQLDLFGPFTGERRSLIFVFLSWVWIPPFSADIRGEAARFTGGVLAGLPSPVCVRPSLFGSSHHTRGRAPGPRSAADSLPSFGFWHFRKHLECCSGGERGMTR